MSRLRALSSPELGSPESLPSTASNSKQPPGDLGLEGISTNVKLLWKLIQDHIEARKRSHDDWESHRITTMVTILDDVKTQIQKSKRSSNKKEFRRCNTDLKPNRSQMPSSPNELAHPPVPEDVHMLRKELNASLAARKNLQMICSSLGKEKGIMAVELARKAQELNGAEELVNDLKAQNETLVQKLRACQKEMNSRGGEGDRQESNLLLQERNKALSEQLLKSLEGYRPLRRRYKELQEENAVIVNVFKEIDDKVENGIQRIHGLRERVSRSDDEAANLEEEILGLEELFDGISSLISKYIEKKKE